MKYSFNIFPSLKEYFIRTPPPCVRVPRSHVSKNRSDPEFNPEFRGG